MKLIFVHGPVACGKLTIAKEVAASTGLRLFHNHLTVDLVGSFFEFGSEGFVRLRESIWIESFQQAAQHGRGSSPRYERDAASRSGGANRRANQFRRLSDRILRKRDKDGAATG